jgi:hypothetical protein
VETLAGLEAGRNSENLGECAEEDTEKERTNIYRIQIRKREVREESERGGKAVKYK